MSLAKKSIKWLVAAIVIFALVLSVSLAMGSATRASADSIPVAPDTTDESVVVVEVTDSLGYTTYPNFVYEALAANATRTFTVKYYVEIPSAAASGEYSILNFSPALALPSSDVKKPSLININTAMSAYADLEGVTGNDSYLGGDATAFSVVLKPGQTIGSLNGVTEGQNGYVTGDYLFEATYVLDDEEAVVGEYELIFIDDDQDEDDGSKIAPDGDGVVYIPAIDNESFTISEIIDAPVFDATTLTFNGGTQDVFTVPGNAAYSEAQGSVLSAMHVGDYTAIFTLPAGCYIWRISEGNNTYSYSVEDYEIDWEIVVKTVAIPTAGAANDNTYTYNGQDKTYAFASAIESDFITVSNNVQSLADTYTITVSLTYAGDTKWSDDTTAAKTADANDDAYTLVINKKPIAIPEYTGGVYTGSAQGVPSSADYNIQDGNGSVVSAITVGNYASILSLTDTANTCWENSDALTQTINWAITPASVSEPVFDTSVFNAQSGNGFVYDGEFHEVYWTNESLPDANIADYVESATSVKKAENAGNYTVYFALSDKTNYVWATSGTADDVAYNWFIETKKIAVPTLGSDTYTFTATWANNESTPVEQTYQFATLDSANITVTGNVQTYAGAYDVTASLKDTDNTEWATGGTEDIVFDDAFVIGARTVTAPVAASENTYQYDGTEKTFAFSTAVDPAYATTADTTAINVGSYTPTATLRYKNSSVWSTTHVNADLPFTDQFVITPILIDVPVPADVTYTYNREEQTFRWATEPDERLGISGTKRTHGGSQTVTAALPQNYAWNDANHTTAAKTFTFTINAKVVTRPVADFEFVTYDGTVKTLTFEADSLVDSAFYNDAVGELSKTNANPNGWYNVSFTLKSDLAADNVWADYGTAGSVNYSWRIIRANVNVAFAAESYSSVFDAAISTPSLSITGDPIAAADVDGLNIHIEGTPTVGDDVGAYPLTIAYTANNNYNVTVAQSINYTITTLYIALPVVDEDTFYYDGNAHSVTFESEPSSTYVNKTSTAQTDIGTYPGATVFALKEAYDGNIAWDDENKTTTDKSFTLKIEASTVTITFKGVFNNVQKTLAEDVELDVFTPLPTYVLRWFKFGGYTFNNASATVATLAMDGEVVYGTYTYAVGEGDVDGDGVISSADVLLLKRWNVGLDRAKKVASAADAWTKSDDLENYPNNAVVLYTALDANGSGKFTATDVVAAREALATGYSFKVIYSDEGFIKIAKVNRVTVSTYAALVGNIALGNAVDLGADIEAANEVFSVDSLIPVDINLNNHRLTVKGFTLNTNTPGATLKISGGSEGGILYTVTGITVTAPSGNVVVSGVNGYSYDGTSVNLSAYSSSLHIESNVAFFIYKAQDPVTNEDYADVHAFVADVYPENVEQATEEQITELNTAITTLATTRIGETSDRMQDIANIKASDKSESQKAEEINALDVKKAILEVPIDTHVVVEENAALNVDKLVVKEQANEAATAQDVVTTFSIEVKSTSEVTVTVDISEIKDDSGEETVYYVENVNISGSSSTVEIVKAQDQQVEVKKYVAQIGTASYESVQAAINAAQNADTIKLIADVADGDGLAIPDGTVKNITIDFNGKTYNVKQGAVGSPGTVNQVMHWSRNSTLTLKNGTFTVDENVSSDVIMGMQNYATLTVTNMVIDLRNVPTDIYPAGKGAYTGYQRPFFNTNFGSLTMTGSTVKLPATAQYGVYFAVPGNTITNSTIEGTIVLDDDEANVTVVNSTFTSAISYFAGKTVINDNNLYRFLDSNDTFVAAIGVNGYATLTDAIAAAQNGDTITLLADVADGDGLAIPDGTVKNITIDFNGKTYNVKQGAVGSAGTVNQVMHWSRNSTVTLMNGTFTVDENVSSDVIMGMQNYATLTVTNMVIDLRNVPTDIYPAGKGAYTGYQRPFFNTNFGSLTMTGSTVKVPATAQYGVYFAVPGNTITNSTIEGTIVLDDDEANVTIVNSTFTNAISYFATATVVHEGNLYYLTTPVTTEAELNAALATNQSVIAIGANFTTQNVISITRDVTIEGNGYTITGGFKRIVDVAESDVTLTINNLTLTSATSERGLNIWNTAEETDVTLNNVTIDVINYAINYENGAESATLTVNDSYLKGWGAINAHCNNSTLTVNDSTLYGINRTNDHTYGFNTITIDGSSLFGAQEGEYGANNTFVFDGCTIIAEVRDTFQKWISFQYAASGNVATVVVSDCVILDAPNGNDKSADMTIDGTNNAVVMALDADQYAAVVGKGFTIADNGDGTYTITKKISNISYFGYPKNFYEVFTEGWLENAEAFTLTDDVTLNADVVFARNRAAAIAVSGGTFQMNLDGNTISGVGKILLPVGVTCVTDSKASIAGLFEAPDGEVIIESIDADGNYIYAVGVAYVKTKAEFTAAITAGAKTLVICADINLSMYTYNRDMDITIDLNGYTLTTTMTGITFSAARTLNIKDSSANGTGAINSTGNYAINMGTSSTADTEINIYGGTLTGKTSAAVKVNDGTLNVYGGTLTCPAADKYAILNYEGYAGTVNIFDGTFTAAVAVANNGTGEVNIYGGTFSADPSDFVAPCYMAVEDEGTWTVVEAEITITTFAELKAAIEDVNAGNIVYPTLIIANDIAFEEELYISKSVYIMGDGTTKFIGFNATKNYNDAFFIEATEDDQEITFDGIIFDHFCYYSDVANETPSTSNTVKNSDAYIIYGGRCAASTTLSIMDCQFLGTSRTMISADSIADGGCRGSIFIENCVFDATDRLMNTLNMLEFYGDENGALYVMITDCTFKEATEQNATWATSAIASFGNTDLTVAGCTFISCQIAIAVDDTFDRQYESETYPLYCATEVTLAENTYVNCKWGYNARFIVEEQPENTVLAAEYFYEGKFYIAAEYDYEIMGTEGEDAKYLTSIYYYILAPEVDIVGGGESVEGDPGLDD